MHARAIASDITTNFNSATVVLGFMPTLLATIGPSIAEMAVLSSYRPFLGFLIALGAPANWPTRLLEYNYPARVLGSSGNEARGVLLVVHIAPRFKWTVAPISALQYILAAAAVVNVAWTSVELGRRSILSWGCTTTFGPLLWTSLAGVVHLVAVASFVCVRKGAYSKELQKNGEDFESRSATSKIGRRLAGMMTSEVTIYVEQRLHEDDENARVPPIAVVSNVLAGCGGFVHLVFGTIIFSSLLFVSVWDALNHILTRYNISAIVCRLIVVIEVAGLRGKGETKY
jgi:hypothetical protein